MKSRDAMLVVGLATMVGLAACGSQSNATGGGAILSSPPRASAGASHAATPLPASPTAQLPGSPSATASATAPSNPFFKGALQFSIAEAERKTGLGYIGGGCATGQACLSKASETDGENATYVGFDASGYPGGTRCYVYVYYDVVLGWQDFATLCGSVAGFAPVYGQSEPVRVSGVCANVRSGPGLNQPIVGCLPNGTIVKIDATPTHADGKMWWGVYSESVSGMMSQEFLVR
jgi:hypothetical protein